MEEEGGNGPRHITVSTVVLVGVKERENGTRNGSHQVSWVSS